MRRHADPTRSGTARPPACLPRAPVSNLFMHTANTTLIHCSVSVPVSRPCARYDRRYKHRNALHVVNLRAYGPLFLCPALGPMDPWTQMPHARRSPPDSDGLNSRQSRPSLRATNASSIETVGDYAVLRRAAWPLGRSRDSRVCDGPQKYHAGA